MKPTLRDWLVLGGMLALLAGCAAALATHRHPLGLALGLACLVLDEAVPPRRP